MRLAEALAQEHPAYRSRVRALRRYILTTLSEPAPVAEDLLLGLTPAQRQAFVANLKQIISNSQEPAQATELNALVDEAVAP